MYRVSLANVTAKRSCLPLHEKHQATPWGCYIDPTEAGNIYSGMAVTRTSANTVKLYAGTSATALPFGIAALDRNTVIDDTQGMDLALFAVWLGGPDAMFQVDAPAFDTAGTYAVPTDGTRQLIYATSGGVLTSVVDGVAIAELVEVVSLTRLVIRLSLPTTIPNTIN